MAWKKNDMAAVQIEDMSQEAWASEKRMDIPFS